MRTSNRLNWIVVILGIWEGLAPFILGYSDIAAAVWNAIIVGLALIVFAAWSAITDNPSTARALDWIDTAIGVWLILAPFILGYSVITVALWNAIIVGAIVAVLSAWAAVSIQSVSETTYE